MEPYKARWPELLAEELCGLDTWDEQAFLDRVFQVFHGDDIFAYLIALPPEAGLTRRVVRQMLSERLMNTEQMSTIMRHCWPTVLEWLSPSDRVLGSLFRETLMPRSSLQVENDQEAYTNEFPESSATLTDVAPTIQDNRSKSWVRRWLGLGAKR